MACLAERQTNTNIIDFSVTRPELKSTIYNTQGEHANHYITDMDWSNQMSIVTTQTILATLQITLYVHSRNSS
jgi:hypothetical protein